MKILKQLPLLVRDFQGVYKELRDLYIWAKDKEKVIEGQSGEIDNLNTNVSSLEARISALENYNNSIAAGKFSVQGSYGGAQHTAPFIITSSGLIPQSGYYIITAVVTVIAASASTSTSTFGLYINGNRVSYWEINMNNANEEVNPYITYMGYLNKDDVVIFKYDNGTISWGFWANRLQGYMVDV